MEDYIIWLKSGESMTGTVKKDTLKILEDAFINFTEGNKKVSFDDEDGRAVVDLSRVEAIGINKLCEGKQTGFIFNKGID